MKGLTPRTLFAIDGFGAVISAFLLGVILVEYEAYFGMPKHALYVLASIPCFFALYDAVCYSLLRQYTKPYLIIIATANIMYCLVSVGFLIRYAKSIQPFGWVYFIIEIWLVLLLSSIETKIHKQFMRRA